MMRYLGRRVVGAVAVCAVLSVLGFRSCHAGPLAGADRPGAPAASSARCYNGWVADAGGRCHRP